MDRINIQIIGDYDIRGQWLPTKLLDIEGLELSPLDREVLEELRRREHGGEPHVVLNHAAMVYFEKEDIPAMAWEILDDHLEHPVGDDWILSRNLTGDLILVAEEDYPAFLDLLAED